MEKIIKVYKINSEQQKQNSDSRICPIVKKGDVLIFDFSFISFINDNEKKRRVLLFSIHRKGRGIRLKGKRDNKLFLGAFSDKSSVKSLVMQLIIFLEVILGVRISISIKDDKVIAII